MQIQRENESNMMKSTVRLECLKKKNISSIFLAQNLLIQSAKKKKIIPLKCDRMPLTFSCYLLNRCSFPGKN